MQYQCHLCGQCFPEPEACDEHQTACWQATEPCSSEPQPSQPGTSASAGRMPVKWTEERVDLLLDYMESNYKKFVKMSGSGKRAAWREAGDLLGVTAEEARVRWNSMCNSYRRSRDHAGPRNSGRGRATPWKHFQRMHRIVGDSPASSATYVMASMPSTVPVPEPPMAAPATSGPEPAASQRQSAAVRPTTQDAHSSPVGLQRTTARRERFSALNEWYGRRAEFEERRSVDYRARTAALEKLSEGLLTLQKPSAKKEEKSTQTEPAAAPPKAEQETPADALRDLTHRFRTITRRCLGGGFTTELMVDIFRQMANELPQ